MIKPSSASSRAQLTQLAQCARMHELAVAECTAGTDWDGSKARRSQDMLEQLAEQAADLGMDGLHSAALDVYAYMAAFADERRSPTPQQFEQLQRLNAALASQLPESDRMRVLALLPEMPPAARDELAQRLHSARIGVRFVEEGDALELELRRSTPQLLLVDNALIPAVAEMLEALSEHIQAAVRVPLLSCSMTAETGARLRALAAGADDHVDDARDPELVDVLLAAASGPGEEGFRVLVVEDDRQMAMYCKRVLGKVGMQVECVARPQDVEATVARFAPDLVLMDLYLPEQDGLALTERLRASGNALLLPIVFLSGESSADARFQAIAAGGDDFLTKPVRPRHLVAAVRSRIQRVRNLSRQIGRAAPAARRCTLRKAAFLELLGNEAALAGRHLLAIGIDRWDELEAQLDLAARHTLEIELQQLLASLLPDTAAISLWRDGGFGVLLRDGSSTAAGTLVETLIARVEAHRFAGGAAPARLTISIGLVGPDHQLDRDSWIRTALAALASASRMGGNRSESIAVCADCSLPPERLLWLRERIREATLGRGVVTEFQPILPLRGHRAGGYSMLMSLNDRGDSLQGASRQEYLQVARSDGNLALLERIALVRAIEALDHLQLRGLPIDIHVPLDLAALTHDQMAWLEAELSARPACASHLALEFDADTLLSRPPLLALVRRLRQLGVRVVACNRHATLASLAALLPLPIDAARYSATAIPEQRGGNVDGSLQSMLRQWHLLGRSVVLDEVDSVAQLSRLWSLGIDDLQGRAIGAATPLLDFDFTEAGQS